jgi:hypothetical protein
VFAVLALRCRHEPLCVVYDYTMAHCMILCVVLHYVVLNMCHRERWENVLYYDLNKCVAEIFIVLQVHYHDRSWCTDSSAVGIIVGQNLWPMKMGLETCDSRPSIA